MESVWAHVVKVQKYCMHDFVNQDITVSGQVLFPQVTSFLQTRQRQWLIALVLIASSFKGFHNLRQEWV